MAITFRTPDGGPYSGRRRIVVCGGWPQQSYLLEWRHRRLGRGFAAAERGRNAAGSLIGSRRRLRRSGVRSGARRARVTRDGGGGDHAHAGCVWAVRPRHAARARGGQERVRALWTAVLPYVDALRAHTIRLGSAEGRLACCVGLTRHSGTVPREGVYMYLDRSSTRSEVPQGDPRLSFG